MKTISIKGFLTNSSFRLVETNYVPSRNSIVLFRALLKIFKFGGSSLFLRKTCFLLVETDFLLIEVTFFHFRDTPATERYFLSSRNIFLNRFFILYGGDGFSVLWKPFSLISSSFSTSGKLH